MVAQIDTRFIKARPWKVWSRLLAYTLFEGRPLTTRGRWINPLVFAAYRLWSFLPLRDRATRPVFILGVGRSGTTILGTILALHRDVGYLNEPKALWQAALGDDDLVGSYSDTPGRYRMHRQDAAPEKLRHLRQFYQAFLHLSLSRRVVDKYPELLFRNDVIDAAFPDARKIVLLRNGAHTCQSIENWTARNATADARTQKRTGWWGRDLRKWQLLLTELVDPDPFFASAREAIRNLDRDVDMAAVEWIVTMREAMELQESANRRLLFVRYEELVSDPKRVLADILRFCDLPEDRVMLNYGSSVLKQAPRYAAPQLHPAIRPLFDATMAQLGYAKA